MSKRIATAITAGAVALTARWTARAREEEDRQVPPPGVIGAVETDTPTRPSELPPDRIPELRPKPAKPARPSERTSTSVAAAPPADQASGVARGESRSTGERLRFVPRALLFVPRIALEVAGAPIRASLYAYDRYQVNARAKEVFWNDTGTVGLYPVFDLQTDYGLTGGARFIHRDLFGEMERLSMRASFGGIYNQQYSASLNSGDRFGGTIRALASRYLDGEPLGGHPREGVREGDPNDRVPYQLRREIRGAFAIFAWLDHTDMKEDNTLDMYVEDPGDKKVHYVVHYLVDFGKALGIKARTALNRAGGRAYALDLRDSAASLVSLGLWKRPWEDRSWPDIPGVGMFESRVYHPGTWKPNSPQYVPFLDADRFDNFWGSKILIRFTSPSSPRAAARASASRTCRSATGWPARRRRRPATGRARSTATAAGCPGAWS